jgi:hypothetical protein
LARDTTKASKIPDIYDKFSPNFPSTADFMQALVGEIDLG